MGDVYLGAGRVAKSPRKQQGFHLFTDRWISGLFVGRSELKRPHLGLSCGETDLRSIRRPERIETESAENDFLALHISGLFVGRSELKPEGDPPVVCKLESPVYS